MFTSQGAKMCTITQFCHGSGNALGVTCSLHCGNTVVLPSPVFDAKKTLEAIIQERWDLCENSLQILEEIVIISLKTIC
jgi:hypothetical protein